MATPPFIIGVAGGSGSGKTTVAKRLTSALASEQVLTISHDNYYRDQAGIPMSERRKVNYDHPDSLETELLVQHIQALSSGQKITQPCFDFVEHTRSSQTQVLHPASVIIVEGILIFTDEALRSLFQLKIFVDTDDDIRFIRRLQRDIAERGREMESVIDQYLQTVKPMYDQFVEPSKRFADIIIPEGGHNEAALSLLTARVKELV